VTRHVKEIFGSGRSGTGGTPPAPAALAAKVRTLAPSMTRSMQRVAEAVASDPAGCAALTVTGLAERTGTSEATVVRTARLLGYPGYRDLRLALAGLAAQQQSGRAPAITTDIAVDDPIADVVAKLALDEQQTLADTAAGLDTVQLGAAVAALASARRTDVYGVLAEGTRDGGIVAFQADEIDDRLQSGWSVLVVGPAEHVEDRAELVAAFERMGDPWAPGTRQLVARISPAEVTGRRFYRS